MSKTARRSSSRRSSSRTHRSQSGCSKRTNQAVQTISSSIYETPPIDLTSCYPEGPTKAFGHGKSGAYIFLVDTPEGQRIVKYYHDAYKPSSNPMEQRDNAINNVRPFREVLTLSALSDTDGFSKVYRVNIAHTPIAWFRKLKLPLPKTNTTCGLIIEMSLAPGEPLNQIDLTQFDDDKLRAIGFRILHLLGSAQRILGTSFRHNDLHPGNIIINPKKRVRTTIHLNDNTTVCFKGPQVTIIDFDLAHVSKSWFVQTIGRSSLYYKLITIARKFKPFDKVTLLFLKNRYGISPSVLLRSLRATTPDVANWLMIMHILLNFRRTSPTCPPKLCHSVTGCLNANQDLLPKNATRKKRTDVRVNQMSKAHG